ncbi:MAG: hypothetical protein KAR38_06715 [Calditrichia bacterium]|nr:hypothetical protein [Calditrichia bacterium]
MSKIIIGIHGLGNKPPEIDMTNWWMSAIDEGLKRISKKSLSIEFEMVYWADILHEKPLNLYLRNKKDPLYLHEPYITGNSYNLKSPGKIRSAVLKYMEEQLDKIFLAEDMTLNFEGVNDTIIHRYFTDLASYYAEDNSIREKIRERLVTVLQKHKGKEILLVSHSMGSIIAYDVLTRTAPELRINTFITIGSPLGLPVIVSRIFGELNKDSTLVTELRTPENIQHSWYNISDPEDLVAFDHTLADDYLSNSLQVRAEDVDVYNDYEIDGERNPHKSFGYLRTPELARIIDDFLSYKEATWLIKKYKIIKQWVINSLKYFKSKMGKK